MPLPSRDRKKPTFYRTESIFSSVARSITPKRLDVGGNTSWRWVKRWGRIFQQGHYWWRGRECLRYQILLWQCWMECKIRCDYVDPFDDSYRLICLLLHYTIYIFFKSVLFYRVIIWGSWIWNCWGIRGSSFTSLCLRNLLFGFFRTYLCPTFLSSLPTSCRPLQAFHLPWQGILIFRDQGVQNLRQWRKRRDHWWRQQFYFFTK